MDDFKKSFSRRVLFVLGLVFLFGIGCFIQILLLSINERKFYSGDPSVCLDKSNPDWHNDPLAQDSNCKCTVIMNDIEPVRGDILDDEGNILASNFTVFDVVIDGRVLEKDSLGCKIHCKRMFRSNNQEVANLINDLATQFYNQFSNRFLHNKAYYQAKISEAIIDKKNVILLKSDLQSQSKLITSEDTAFVRKLPVFHDGCKKQCISFPAFYKRIYPYGELAKRAIGTVLPGAPGGLEYTFNEQLAGKKGAQKMLIIDKIRVPSNKFSDPKDGVTLHTSLNLKMQNVVYEALMDKLFECKADWGCVVVMEVQTGEIKAIANLKRYTNEKGNVGYAELLNHAFRQECEPGSTFKVASALAYLEKMKPGTEKTYMLCGCDIEHHFRNDTKKFLTKCSKVDQIGGVRHRWGGINEILQLSINEGTGTMIFDAYQNNFKSYLAALDSMGITSPLETQLGSVKTPQIKRTEKAMRVFYSTTWGEFKMAPIQTLTYYNAIANNGKMMCPKIVNYTSINDKKIEEFAPIIIKEQIVRKDVIERIKKILEGVISGPFAEGAFRNANPSFAGKTGTRGIYVQGEDGKWHYDYSRNGISFCGYFPSKDPKYSMVVYINDVNSKSGEATKLFYTMAKRIMSLETTDLMKPINKNGGIINTQYQNLLK